MGLAHELINIPIIGEHAKGQEFMTIQSHCRAIFCHYNVLDGKLRVTEVYELYM